MPVHIAHGSGTAEIVLALTRLIQPIQPRQHLLKRYIGVHVDRRDWAAVAQLLLPAASVMLAKL